MAQEVALLHPDLQAYVADLLARAPQAGVVRYQVQTTYRGRQSQEAEFNEGDSAAHFGDSPHNYMPALAVDIAPIVLTRAGHEGTEAQSNDPADYAQLVAVAEARGLQSGRTWHDWPHVQVRNWRAELNPGQQPGNHDAETSGTPQRAGAPLLLLLLAVAVLMGSDL